jgi:hypothetical protein
MLNLKILILVSSLIVFSSVQIQAQTDKVQQGVIFKKGTNSRIANAEIVNRNKKTKVHSNDFGIFRIMASANDTLVISGAGYLTQHLAVIDFKDLVVYLQAASELQEVHVTEQTIRQELDEARNSYRSKGVYYKGKPPLYLLIFKPLTFINELVGKNAAQARRFNKFADREIDYYEVSGKFNNTAIKRTVPIKDDELEDFKSKYWPTAEQVKRWNDYDVITYIKRSYAEFKDSKPKE